jgi:hypothetical protein
LEQRAAQAERKRIKRAKGCRKGCTDLSVEEICRPPD